MLLILMCTCFLLMSLSPFDTVDRGILDRVLSSLVVLAWLRHAYFEYHAHVRLRFKLAARLGVLLFWASASFVFDLLLVVLGVWSHDAFEGLVQIQGS